MKLLRCLHIALLASTGLLLPGTVAATQQQLRSIEGIVPQAATAMGRQIDRQVAARLQQPDTPAQGVSLAITIPVDVNDLEASNPLARQMAEELARWFVQAGYAVQEIRKAKTVMFEPATGEMLLTRRTDLLGSDAVRSAAILAGTYTVTPGAVRFNIKIVHTSSQEVLGMSTISVPVDNDIRGLLGSGAFSRGIGIAPTVATTLP